MNLPIWLEIICGVLLLYGFRSGWRNGLIKEICSTVGFIAGCLLAWYCHTNYNVGWGWTLLLCIVFPIVLGFLASLVSKMLSAIIIVGTINKFLGAIVGLLKYGILIVFIIAILKEVEGWGTLLQ